MPTLGRRTAFRLEHRLRPQRPDRQRRDRIRPAHPRQALGEAPSEESVAAPRSCRGLSRRLTIHSTLSVVLLHADCAHFVLNDLFVASQARGKGFAKLLLAAACDYGRSVGAIRLSLSTAVDNDSAQSLYEVAGWIRDNQFSGYTISLI